MILESIRTATSGFAEVQISEKKLWKQRLSLEGVWRYKDFYCTTINIMGKAANSSETIHNLHQELKSIVKPNKVPQNDTRKLCKFFLVLNYLRQFLASFYEASSGFAMILGLK